MSNVEHAIVPQMASGDVLSLEDFLGRWEAMSHLAFVELIGGVVYMPSPLSLEHGSMDNAVSGWLMVYRASTPGCDAVNNATWVMGQKDAPQPDTALYVLPAYGGAVRMRGRLLAGAPDFLAEICLTSAAYDLHQKLEVYERSGVREYLAVLLYEREIRWHRLAGSAFEVVPAPADGIHRSAVFPGLWLDAAALLAGDLARVLAVLQQGIASPEHAAFVERLAMAKAP